MLQFIDSAEFSGKFIGSDVPYRVGPPKPGYNENGIAFATPSE